MEPSLGLRVVRGPDWRWEDQDGGEGCVGTVAEFGREKKAVAVQWDCGTRAMYRSGAEDKFDLRVLDTAPTGLKFPEVVCSGCYAEGVAGTYWKCAHCYEYSLCHSCYLLGRHCQEHPFFRVQSTKHTPRVMVPPRADARKVETRGIFQGARVVRGKDWKFGDQDGGAGSIGTVVSVRGWKDMTARSAADVKWSATKKTNVCRVGHNGKVDLKCFTTESWGYYYPEHLCTLGSDASVVYFNEDEIVAGDMITVKLEPDVFAIMQQSIGMWEDEMLQMLNGYGIVLSVLKHQRLYTSLNLSEHVLCYTAATKHCRQGERVRVISDYPELHRLQSQESIWDDSLVTTIGQVGQVAEICLNNMVEVTVQGRKYLYHPQCLLPASRESLQDEQDTAVSRNEVTSHRKNFRHRFMTAGITDVAILDGDLKALSNFIYSNASKPKLKKTLLVYYAVTGMTPALKLLLRSGVDPNSFVNDSGGTTLNLAVRLSNHLGVANLLMAGASVTIGYENPLYTAAVKGLVSVVETFVVHAKEHLNVRHPDNKCAPILFAALHGNSMVCNTLAAQESVKIDMETYRMNIPLHAAVMHAYWDVMECLVGWGANLNHANNKGETPLHVVVKLKSSVVPDSERLREVQRQYFRSSGGKTAPGYVIVACFLAQEGADLHVKDKEGLSPFQILPPEVASLVTACVKSYYDSERSFHGSLCRTRQSRMCELPMQLQPYSGRGRTASAVGASPPLAGSSQRSSKPLANFANTTEGKNEMMKSKPKSTYDFGKMKDSLTSSVEEKNVIVTSKTAHKAGYDLKEERKKPSTSSSGDIKGSQQTQATAAEPSGNCSPNSMSQGDLCLLCEEDPASVTFYPCGHTVMCSRCAERTKKCYLCKAVITTKSTK